MNTAILNTDDCSAGFVGSQKWDDDGQGQKQDKQEPAQRIEQKGRSLLVQVSSPSIVSYPQRKGPPSTLGY
jgi:hypothetical protein